MVSPRSVIAAASCPFGPLVVDYDERVLRPRSWTLAQAIWAAELAREAPAGLVDVCAGVGHIGLAAAVLSGRGLVSVERDPVAAGFARVNGERARIGTHEVRVSDLGSALRPAERFGIIIADPPYLPTDEVAAWPDDPSVAIDGGPDGLDVIRACTGLAEDHLAPGGTMLLQVAGASQAEQVIGLLAGSPLRPGGVWVVDERRAVLAVCR